MNLQERQSLPKLWLYSFSVTNKALPKLFVALLGYILLGVAIYAIVKSMAMSLVMFFMPMFMTTNKVELILRALLIAVAFWGVAQLYSKFFITVGTRLVAQIAERQRASLLETTFDSIKPAFFAVVYSILAALPAIVVYVPLYFLLRDANPLMGKVIHWIFRLILFFTLYIRLTYAQAFIMLKDYGPIEGLLESWRMTGGMKYIDTLLMWIMFLATWVIYTVLAVGVVIALRAVIPLHLASLFDVSQTWIGWIVLVLVAVLVAFFCFCQVWVFQFVTFLNRYYTNDGGAFNTDPGPRQPNNFVPLPAVELPSFRPTPVQEEHVGEGLPPATDRVAAQQQAAQYAQTPKPQPQQDAAEITGMNLLGAATKPAAQPAAQPSGAADDLHNLQISQSSINTAEEDANEITQHLHQVYTPSQDNIIQYGDEDRMPTILFDDEMAKQLEETAQKFAAKKNKPEGPQEPDSIKISE